MLCISSYVLSVIFQYLFFSGGKIVTYIIFNNYWDIFNSPCYMKYINIQLLKLAITEEPLLLIYC